MKEQLSLNYHSTRTSDIVITELLVYEEIKLAIANHKNNIRLIK